MLAWPPVRTWHQRALTGALLVSTLGATGAVTLALPAILQHTAANWAVGVDGWLVVTIAAGSRLTHTIFWLAAPVVFAVAAAVPAGAPEVVVMCTRALGILGLQIPIALAARAVERSAEAARELHLTREAIRTQQIMAAALHEDRLRRSRAVAAVVEPVLAGLAGTALDDVLRKRCAVAAAQVRRLLVGWNRADGDPLGDDLTGCLDEMQAAGTRVEVAVHADCLPFALRRAACDVIRTIAATPVAQLRLTVVLVAGRLCLSIVARSAGRGVPPLLSEVSEPLVIRTTTNGATVWVELTCPV
jgi:hypothetical protein